MGETGTAGMRAWVEEACGGRITSWRRAPAGGSRETYLVDVSRGGDGDLPLVLRMEAGGSFTGTEINVSKEAVVYRALASSGVPVPRVLGVAPGGAALLMERVPGSAELSSLPEHEQEAVLGAFVDVVADLHNVDPATLDLPGFPVPRTPAEHATIDLDSWAALARQGAPDLDPLVRYAGAYLRHHPPAEVARTVLVQGDTGPGNFLFDGGRVTALVDMEFAHLGDPMDDLAWILMRGGDEVVPHLARYSERTGIPLDPGSISYYRVAVQYRCAVTTSLAVARGGGARGWAPYLLVTERYVLGVADSLAAHVGVEQPHVPVLDSPPTERTASYDALLAGIRAGVKAIDDEEARERTRNLQILVHYLRAFDRSGDRLAGEDERDRHRSLGVGDGSALAAAAEEGGRRGDVETLGYLLRRTKRNAALWATLLDRPRR